MHVKTAIATKAGTIVVKGFALNTLKLTPRLLVAVKMKLAPLYGSAGRSPLVMKGLTSCFHQGGSWKYNTWIPTLSARLTNHTNIAVDVVQSAIDPSCDNVRHVVAGPRIQITLPGRAGYDIDRSNLLNSRRPSYAYSWKRGSN